MKKIHITFYILLIGCITLLVAAGQPMTTGKITSFQALDAPFDDGTGIVLSWKPLPKEMRVIQYRIYRGISPDTLYYFGQVEVDPKAGVAAEKMYYYDKDFQSLLSIDSPPRLKQEKQQPSDSPLFQAVPRDPQILDRLLPHFTVLGVMDQANLYKRSVKITKADKSVFAGLRPAQFEQLAANPNPGEKYYYTVLAKDEKGNLLPYADIQSATPIDNPPDKTSQLSAVYVYDSKEFRMEWVPAFSSNDVAAWQYWLLPKTLQPAFDAWQSIYTEQGGVAAPWTKQAILLAEKPNDYNYFLTLESKDGKIVNPDGTLGSSLPSANLLDYNIVLGAMDYAGFVSYAMGNPLRVMTSAQLPKKSVFDVKDKPDDKGDTSALSFGNAIGYITQAAYTSAKKNKIRINYELSENQNFKIDRLFFQFYTPDGKLIGTVKERYPDKIITLKSAHLATDITSLHVKLAFIYKGSKQMTEYDVAQDLTYDQQTRRFMSSEIYYKGENLSKNYYQVFRKNLLQGTFSSIKKVATISRNYEDIVNFETTLDKLVSGVDVKTGRLLIEPILTFAVDTKTGMPLSVNIYRDEQEKAVKAMQDEIKSLQAMLKSSPAQADSLQQVLSEKETYLSALLNHPAYKLAAKQRSAKGWFQVLHREQVKNSRSYAYRVMKTDSNGAYTFSDESKAYIPIANWFNMNFLIALIASFIFMVIVIYTGFKAKRGADLYLRPIAGLQEIDNAVGRATEMGRPILYVPGWSTIGEITTIASMMILNRVAKKAAEYDTRLLVPNSDYYVMPLAQEMVRDAFYEAGRPDSYNPVDVFYICSDQFPYAAGVNGTMIREKSATNFYMGFFNAEALLMTETGNSIGSIQIAGTDAVTQVPFFITTCDYTLIGEEFYAASAYLSKDVELVSMLKAQDYFKFLIIFFILAGALLSTAGFNWLTNSFPTE